MNYRLMSQSRDAAEGGVHKAANFMMNSYTKPGGSGQPVSNYVTTTSPVTDTGGNAVILSASSRCTPTTRCPRTNRALIPRRKAA